MRLGKSYASAHKYVQFYGVAVSDAAGSQVMRSYDIRFGLGDLHYLNFNLIRK